MLVISNFKIKQKRMVHNTKHLMHTFMVLDCVIFFGATLITVLCIMKYIMLSYTVPITSCFSLNLPFIVTTTTIREKNWIWTCVAYLEAYDHQTAIQYHPTELIFSITIDGSGTFIHLETLETYTWQILTVNIPQEVHDTGRKMVKT